MSEPFIRCGYCGSEHHTSAECSVGHELRDDFDDEDNEPFFDDDDAVD